MKNKLKKAIIYVSFAFVSLLFLCFLPPLFNHYSESFSLSFASGESMYPTIKDGDLIVSRPYGAGKDELRKGMIVGLWDTYEKDETISIQHRIIEITKGGVETRGDNNDTPDEGIKKYSQIRSIYCFRVPFHYLGLGRVSSLLLLLFGGLKEEALGFPAFSYLIFFLLMLGFLLDARRRILEKTKTR